MIQVRKSKYEVSDSAAAIAIGDKMTEGKASIFRYNPGKTKTPYPPKHPYMPTGCGDCDKVKLFANKTSCDVCHAVDGLRISESLGKLKDLSGAEYIKGLKRISNYKIFKKIEDNIYSVGIEKSEDYDNLLKAAKKAVSHGYSVHMLPNPKKYKTADFIFAKKGFVALYDLKTISGGGSVGTRLKDSIGQTSRVLLNMNTSYNSYNLAKEIKKYFEYNHNAQEVLIFKKNKRISVLRKHITKNFIKEFRMHYDK